MTTNKLHSTPGPWGVAKWEGMWSVGAWSWGSSTSNNAITIIAQVSDCNGNPTANARLMASAPDLYEKLSDAVRVMNAFIDAGNTACIPERDDAVKALSKARGEQP